MSNRPCFSLAVVKDAEWKGQMENRDGDGWRVEGGGNDGGKAEAVWRVGRKSKSSLGEREETDELRKKMDTPRHR